MENSQDTSTPNNQNIDPTILDVEIKKLQIIRWIYGISFFVIIIITEILTNWIWYLFHEKNYHDYSNSLLYFFLGFSLMGLFGILFLRNENKLFVANFITTGNNLKKTPGVKYGGFLLLILIFAYMSNFVSGNLRDFIWNFTSFYFYKLLLLMFYYYLNGTQHTLHLSIGTEKFFLKNEIPGRILIRVLIIIPLLIFGYLALVLSQMHR